MENPCRKKLIAVTNDSAPLYKGSRGSVADTTFTDAGEDQGC